MTVDGASKAAAPHDDGAVRAADDDDARGLTDSGAKADSSDALRDDAASPSAALVVGAHGTSTDTIMSQPDSPVATKTTTTTTTTTTENANDAATNVATSTAATRSVPPPPPAVAGAGVRRARAARAAQAARVALLDPLPKALVARAGVTTPRRARRRRFVPALHLESHVGLPDVRSLRRSRDAGARSFRGEIDVQVGAGGRRRRA